MPLFRTYHRYHRLTGIVFLSSAPFGYLLTQPSSYHIFPKLPTTTPLSLKAPEPPEEGKIHITPRAICLLPFSGNSSHILPHHIRHRFPPVSHARRACIVYLRSAPAHHTTRISFIASSTYTLADMPPVGHHACTCQFHAPDTPFASCSGKCNRKKAACQGERAYLDKLPPSD